MPSCGRVPLGTLTCSRTKTLHTVILRRNSLPRHVYSKARRYASTAFAVKHSRTLASQPDIPEVLTVSHKTATFLPRVLPRKRDTGHEIKNVEFWDGVLDSTRVGLSHTTGDRVAHITVYGYDEHSGAQDLVSALLEEPFSSDLVKQSIRARHKPGDTSDLIIRYEPSDSTRSGRNLTLRSSWLQQFPLPVELHESSNSKQPRTRAALNLFSADIPIIVCNPITTPLEKIFSDRSLPLHHPNAILVITSASYTRQSLTELYPIPPGLRALFVDPISALRGLEALSCNPSSALAVQRYQDNFVQSGVPNVTSTISHIFSFSQFDLLNLLRTRTALHALQAALSACSSELAGAMREAGTVDSDISGLHNHVSELQRRIDSEIFGPSEASAVSEAVSEAKREVQPTLDHLSWWRLIWKVDDIADIVSTSVHRAWCRQLEEKLIYHSGRLSLTQQHLATAGKDVLSKHAPMSYFHSSLLQNQVAQIERSPEYSVQPQSLIEPIHLRRNQLWYPTAMLHSAAQRVTIGTGASVLSGFGIAWAGWAGQLGLLGTLSPGLETETAAGIGLFTAALGVRWAIGRWEKAKRKWWKDWDRVGEGLERDLKAALDRTVERQVAVVPMTVHEGMTKLVNQRREGIRTLHDELSTLEFQTRRIETSIS